MSLLGDLGQRLLQPLIDALEKALAPFKRVIDLVKRFFTGFKDSFDKGNALATEIINEIDAWKNFTQAVPVRTGVINIPKAVEQTQKVIDEIKNAWRAIVDLFKEIKKQSQGQQEDPTTEAEDIMTDLESGGAKNLIEKFPKVAKAFEKVLGFLAVIVGVLETLQKTIDDLKTIVDAIKDIREEIEFGSTIFLQQKNARKRVNLTDGSAMSIRVGSLHS